MAAKKTNGGSSKPAASKKPQMSDREKMKALGLNDDEIQRLDLQGINFGKLLKFITGFIKLVSETFGDSTTTTGGGGNGGIFGAQKAPKEDSDRLKEVGVPAKAAALGGGRLLEIIRILLALLGGLGGVGSTGLPQGEGNIRGVGTYREAHGENPPPR